MTVINVLKQALADTYAVYLKTQNYHWNVTGSNFKTLHLMFEEQYTELALAVDVLAERIRALGDKVQASFRAFSALSKLDDNDDSATADAMLRDLIQAHEHVMARLKVVDEAADKERDAATQSMVDARLEAHQKTLWMLRASLA